MLVLTNFTKKFNNYSSTFLIRSCTVLQFNAVTVTCYLLKQYPQYVWLASHFFPFDPSALAEQHLPPLFLQLCI